MPKGESLNGGVLLARNLKTRGGRFFACLSSEGRSSLQGGGNAQRNRRERHLTQKAFFQHHTVRPL